MLFLVSILISRAEVLRRKKGGCAATQVNFANDRCLPHPLAVKFPFFLHCLQVFFFYRMIVRNFFIAATISTK